MGQRCLAFSVLLSCCRCGTYSSTRPLASSHLMDSICVDSPLAMDQRRIADPAATSTDGLTGSRHGRQASGCATRPTLKQHPCRRATGVSSASAHTRLLRRLPTCIPRPRPPLAWQCMCHCSDRLHQQRCFAARLAGCFNCTVLPVIQLHTRHSSNRVITTTSQLVSGKRLPLAATVLIRQALRPADHQRLQLIPEACIVVTFLCVTVVSPLNATA